MTGETALENYGQRPVLMKKILPEVKKRISRRERQNFRLKLHCVPMKHQKRTKMNLPAA